MSDSPVNTVQLQAWLTRMRDGDAVACNELLRAVGGQLERLARKMLRHFPKVRVSAETGDVLQGALMRLLRAVQEVEVASVRDFLGLAALQMRRELLDLARHFGGPHGIATNQVRLAPGGDSQTPDSEPLDRNDNPDELERWCRFHQEVEKLPVSEREVVGLIFYHSWTQADVAAMLQVSERTVRRRWDSALLKLHHALRDVTTEEEDFVKPDP